MNTVNVDLCLCCDRHAVDGFIGVVASAAQHLHKNAKLCVHLLDCGLGKELRARVEETVSRHMPSVSLEIVELDPERLEVFPNPSGLKHATKATYAKMLLHEFFPHLDRVIYLDCDILVQRDLSELAVVPLQGHCLGAVQDTTVGTLGSPVETLAEQMPDLPVEAPYLNAGVLLMDLAKLRREEATTAFVESARRIAAKFGDQSLWNAIYPGQWARLEGHWNRQVFLLPSYNLFPSGPRSIWHFTRDMKPWNFQPRGTHGILALWNCELLRVNWEVTAKPLYRISESVFRSTIKWAYARIRRFA